MSRESKVYHALKSFWGGALLTALTVTSQSHATSLPPLSQVEDSAKQGNANAQGLLGAMYLDGEGVAKDQAKAFYWLNRSAQQGNANAQNSLGAMYLKGAYVQQNLAKGEHLISTAAEQGQATAQFNLAAAYMFGLGVPKDLEKSDYWLRKAAEQGYPEAQQVLNKLLKNAPDVGAND